MPLLQADANPGTASWTNALTQRLTTTDGVTGGTARVIGGRAYSNVADSAAVTNTTSATAFDQTYNIPASTLGLGSTVRIRATVRVTNQAAATNLTVRVLIGAAVIITGLATAPGNEETVNVECWITTRAAAGAAVDTVGGGTMILAGATPAALPTATLPNATALATNGALLIAVDAAWSLADASACILETLFVDVV